MPAAGKSKISTITKAKILAEKRVGMGTSKDIANRYGVAVQTVRNMGSSDRPVSVEVLQLSRSFESGILERAQTNLEIGLVAIGKKISDPDENLSAIVNASKFCYEVYRGLSTTMEPIEKQAASVIEVIRRRAEEKGVSFETELENYIQNFSYLVSRAVRERLQRLYTPTLMD